MHIAHVCHHFSTISNPAVYSYYCKIIDSRGMDRERKQFLVHVLVSPPYFEATFEQLHSTVLCTVLVTHQIRLKLQGKWLYQHHPGFSRLVQA